MPSITEGPCGPHRSAYDGGPVGAGQEMWALCTHPGCTVGTCTGALAAEEPDCADVARLGSLNEVEAHLGDSEAHVLVAPRGLFTRKNPPSRAQLLGQEPLPQGCRIGVTSKAIARRTHKFPLNPRRIEQLDSLLADVTANLPAGSHTPVHLQRWRSDLHTLATKFGADVVTDRVVSYAHQTGRGLGPLLDQVRDELDAEEGVTTALRGKVGDRAARVFPIIPEKALQYLGPRPGERPRHRLVVRDERPAAREHFELRWAERVLGVFDAQLVVDANRAPDAATLAARYRHRRLELRNRIGDVAATVESILPEAEFTHGLKEGPVNETRRSIAGADVPIPSNRAMVQLPSPNGDGILNIVFETRRAVNGAVEVSPVTVLRVPQQSRRQQANATTEELTDRGLQNLRKLLF